MKRVEEEMRSDCSGRHAIYEGTIRHRRFTPVKNEFRYRIFFMYLDLDHLSELSNIHPLWSGDGVNLAYFRRKDYHGNPSIPLADAIRNYVSEKRGKRPDGPVRMLTHLRYFGHCFNPVSFYYCFDKAETTVTDIVVEITNTPWSERFLYLFSDDTSIASSKDWREHSFKKRFHVSPFMDMDINYSWRFRIPEERLNVHMVNYRGEDRLFDASLSLKRLELTRKQLTRMLLSHTAMTLKVVFYIYWQALKLHVKGTPFYSHPSKR